MIGKTEWFRRRKYTGWGLTPRGWQGWAYIAGIIVLFVLLQALPVSEGIKIWLMMGLGVIFAADLVHIMVTMPKDEREKMHEAIAERNTLWVILAVLCVGVAYEAGVGARGTIAFGSWILAAILAGVVTKAATNFYLDRKD